MRCAWLLAALSACSGPGDDGDPDNITMLMVGDNAAVTASSLNLRDAPGTSANILDSMPCSTIVKVLGGPSTGTVLNWWNVDFNGTQGWASGRYMVAQKGFDPTYCTGGLPSTTVAEILSRAMAGVGYSYYWGHAAWSTAASSNPGICSGTCPNCNHSGDFGADCSGFVAKAWQVPRASALETDNHPFTTYDFYNDQLYWTQLARSGIQPGDALVRRVAGEGHIVLFESGDDPFGNIWTYEARACSLGVVHNLRVADTSFIAIHRNGL
jgi:hypothetical protein